MDPEMLRSLMLRIKALEERSSFRLGVVSVASPLAVNLGGSAVPYTNARRLASYTPTIGDLVAVEWINGDLLVHGKIV